MKSCNDKLFGWGLCEDHQLGASNTDNRQVPVPRLISTEKLGKIKKLACGYKHTLVLNEDLEVYSCGCNEYGQLGHKNDQSEFSHVISLSNHPISEIACGAYHNAAIDYTGYLYTWGCNHNGQLGREGDDSGVKLIRSLSEHRVAQVSLGIDHTVVLTDSSRVFTFGANSWGQLGLGFWSDNPLPVPQQLLCLSGLPVRQICAGGTHTVLLSISGAVYTWGANKHGQLGLGSSDESSASSLPSKTTAVGQRACVVVPTLVQSLKGKETVFADCGELHTVLLTRRGEVYAFGANQFGQLGLNSPTKSVTAPCKVGLLEGKTVTQVVCGRSHTLVLVRETGSVYGFGAGTDGQLGNEEFSDSSVPKTVKGPWVSAEVPVDVRKLGSSALSCYVVLRVITGGDHAYIMACKPSVASNLIVPDFRDYDPISPRSICTLCPAILDQLRNALSALALPAPNHAPSLSRMLSFSTAGNNSYSQSTSISNDSSSRQTHATVTRLSTVFSSLGCLAGSCLSTKHFETSRNEHGVDLDAAEDLQHQIFKLLTQNSLRNLIGKLITDVLDVSRSNYPGIESLRALMVLTVSELLNVSRALSGDSSNTTAGSATDGHSMPDSDYSYVIQLVGYNDPGTVLNGFVATINKLDPAPSKIVDNWFAMMRPRFLKRLVLNLNNLIVYTLGLQSSSKEAMRKSREENIRNSLELMKRLYLINESKQRVISYNSFYIPSLSEKVNIDLAFVNWLRECESGGMRFFSFCDYPFVFDASSKARMLTIEARMTMQNAMSEAQRTALLQAFFSNFGMDSTVCPFFALNVRREHLLEDTLNQLTIAEPSTLRKLLRVKFENEEAVDDGGVLKEFFLLIMRDILSPIYGMFQCYPESRMLWFSELNMESDNVFLLVGILCGLAIYNSIITDLSFPLAMFRKLLGEEPCLDDLKELDPIVGRSLQQLLDYEGADFTSVFSLSFSLEIDFFGATRKVELLPGGADIEVTQDNKYLYVNKYVDHVFNQSCKTSYAAFDRGFHQVCTGRALKFFLPMELQSLVVGSEVVDWGELRGNTSYQGVYWDHHPVIEWFWDVLLIEFSIEDKKKFLRFLTGCDRVPVVGFGGLKIVIQPNNSGDDYLPVAHTCANLLDLPLYSSKAVLSHKLSIAIQHTEGFGLV